MTEQRAKLTLKRKPAAVAPEPVAAVEPAPAPVVAPDSEESKNKLRTGMMREVGFYASSRVLAFIASGISQEDWQQHIIDFALQWNELREHGLGEKGITGQAKYIARTTWQRHQPDHWRELMVIEINTRLAMRERESS